MCTCVQYPQFEYQLRFWYVQRYIADYGASFGNFDGFGAQINAEPTTEHQHTNVPT